MSLYLRRIEHRHKEWFATNSSGHFAALCRKVDDADPSSWAVYSGPEDVKPDATGKTLEEALDYMIVTFSSKEKPDKKDEAKAKKRAASRAERSAS